MLKSALVPAALTALALVVPAPAHGACGVTTAKADYESPEIQLYSQGDEILTDHYACLRATGKRRVVGQDSQGEGSASTSVLGVYGRWLWLSSRMYDPDSDSTTVDHTLLDVRTGASANAGPFTEDVALPGALVVAHEGVTARFTDGRTVPLSTDPAASGLAAVGSRVYWRTGEVAHTAVLDLPERTAPGKGPMATKIGRCAPRKGARLELFAAKKLVLTRQGGKLWACRTPNGKTRAVGAATGLAVRSDREVAYLQGGKVSTLNVLTGARTEVAGTAFAATATRLLVVAQDGLHSPVDLLAAAPATEPALSGDSAYWLDGAGAPQVKRLP